MGLFYIQILLYYCCSYFKQTFYFHFFSVFLRGCLVGIEVVDVFGLEAVRFIQKSSDKCVFGFLPSR